MTCFILTSFSSPGEPSVGVTLAGGDGGDQFIGTIGDDTMYGGSGDDVFQASSTDMIFGGAGNDLLRTNNIPSQVDVSQGSKLINLSAFKNVSGNIIVGGTVLGPDADQQNISFGLRVRGPDETHINIGSGEDVVLLAITLHDGTNLIAAMTETSRVLGKEAADGLVAYSFYVFNADGGDVPAGLELDFTYNQHTAVNGAPLIGFAGPLVVPAADDPILEEAGGVMLYSYDGADAVYDNASSEFDGGSGHDTVYYYGSRDDFTILEENGRITVTHIVSSRTDVLHRVEELVFIDGNSAERVDLLDPFADYQKIDGGDGDDILIGGAGKSYITSGGGSDIIRDEGGEDFVLLSGASGTVDIDLGIDDDVIRIGGDFTGNVALSGGAGNDILEIEGGFSGLSGRAMTSRSRWQTARSSQSPISLTTSAMCTVYTALALSKMLL